MAARALRLLAVLALTLTTVSVASAPATGREAHRPHHRLQVVQLGDSYSAGNGAGGYTDTTCYRSPYNYGTQFARSINASYVNRACSGAVIRDLTHPTPKGAAYSRTATYQLTATRPSTAHRQWLRKARAAHLCGTTPTRDGYYARHLGPLIRTGKYWTGIVTCQLEVRAQVSAISGRTDIVLLTIGGNDIGFGNIVVSCLALRDPTTCKQAMDHAEEVLPTTTWGVRHVFDVIRRRSHGHAKVYLLPYPNLLNTADYSIPEPAPTYNFGKALADLQARGNRLQRRGVSAYNQDAGRGRYHWVGPVVDIWKGHGLDPHVVADNTNAWLVPLFAPGRVSAEYVHPTRQGWAASAVALEGYNQKHH